MFHALAGAVVDPGVDGAVASIDYTWEVLPVSGSSAATFCGIDPADDPDFSSSGAQITFGYFAALASALGGAPANATAGFDTWQVDVHLISEPGTGLQLGLTVMCWRRLRGGR